MMTEELLGRLLRKGYQTLVEIEKLLANTGDSDAGTAALDGVLDTSGDIEDKGDSDAPMEEVSDASGDREDTGDREAGAAVLEGVRDTEAGVPPTMKQVFKAKAPIRTSVPRSPSKSPKATLQPRDDDGVLWVKD